MDLPQQLFMDGHPVIGFARRAANGNSPALLTYIRTDIARGFWWSIRILHQSSYTTASE